VDNLFIFAVALLIVYLALVGLGVVAPPIFVGSG
jgi:hypothetical protein